MYLTFEVEEEPGMIEIPSVIDNDIISLEIYSCYDGNTEINFHDRLKHEVNIHELEITLANWGSLRFTDAPHSLNVKRLILKCPGINYLGGAIVENLSIFATDLNINLPLTPAEKLTITQVKNSDAAIIRELLTGLDIIPGCGEFAFGMPGRESLLPTIALPSSVFELSRNFPNLRWAAPVVSWFTDGLDIGSCKLYPAVEDKNSPLIWRVGLYDRTSAPEISHYYEENIRKINYGGSIDDNCVLEYLKKLNLGGIKILFYPLIMVDLPNKPWRGHITGKPEAVDNFFDAQYRPFILHYARLVAGKVDGFIIGSELVGLTRIKSEDDSFPFVKNLINLAREVREILGPGVKLTYAADWSEYHSAGGTLRPLDELWGDAAIDFVGIDAYFPLTDSLRSNISAEEIKKGWHSGPGINYYLSGEEKVPYSPEEKWNHWKNLDYWWRSEHWVNGAQTSWRPKMKPIWFTEFGFPSIDKSPNQPNVFYDPKSSDGGVPKFSNGRRDFAIQLRALRATLEYWKDSEFLEEMLCWAFDARGIGWQERINTANGNLYYDDARLWQYGHWLDGKITKHDNVLYINYPLNVDNLFLYIDSCVIGTQIIDVANILKIVTRELKSYGSVIKATDCDITCREIFELRTELEIKGTDRRLLKLGPKSRSVTVGTEGIAKIIADNLTLSAHSAALFGAEVDVSGGARLIADILTILPIIKKDLLRKGSVDGKFTYEFIDDFILRPLMHCGDLTVIAGECLFRALRLTAGNSLFSCRELEFDGAVTEHQEIVIFQGKKDTITRKRANWTEKRLSQKFHPLDLQSFELGILCESFTTTGSDIAVNRVEIEAEQHFFKAKHLKNSHSKTGKSKRSLTSEAKKYSQHGVTGFIEGTRLVVDSTAYILARDCLKLEGSVIAAEHLTVEAPRVELQGVVIYEHQEFRMVQKGAALKLTANRQELALGASYSRSEQSITIHDEYAEPAYLFGAETLNIRTGVLYSAGGILGGGRGNITAGSWENRALELNSYSDRESSSFTVGGSVSIGQNLTQTGNSVARALSSTRDLARQGNNGNIFASINAVSAGYEAFRNVTGLLTGGIISAGPSLNVGGSVSSASNSNTQYAHAEARFGHLTADIEGDLSGELELKNESEEINAGSINLTRLEDQTSSSSSGMHFSGGVGSSGFSASGGVERNGTSFGLSYADSFTPGRSMFGPRIGVSFSDGRGNNLDVTYASITDSQSLADAYSGGVSGMALRVAENTWRTIESLLPEDNSREENKAPEENKALEALLRAEEEDAALDEAIALDEYSLEEMIRLYENSELFTGEGEEKKCDDIAPPANAALQTLVTESELPALLEVNDNADTSFAKRFKLK